MKIVGMRAPQGLLSRFSVCLKKDDPKEANPTESMEFVLDYLVNQSDDLEGLLDEYYKTFRRKKLVWLFTSATIQILTSLKTLPHKIKFFHKVVQVMLYLFQ